jgi:hypothetical protein
MTGLKVAENFETYFGLLVYDLVIRCKVEVGYADACEIVARHVWMYEQLSHSFFDGFHIVTHLVNVLVAYERHEI